MVQAFKFSEDAAPSIRVRFQVPVCCSSFCDICVGTVSSPLLVSSIRKELISLYSILPVSKDNRGMRCFPHQILILFEFHIYLLEKKYRMYEIPTICTTYCCSSGSNPFLIELPLNRDLSLAFTLFFPERTAPSFPLYSSRTRPFSY